MNTKTRKALAQLLEQINGGVEYPDTSAAVSAENNLTDSESEWVAKPSVRAPGAREAV